MNTVGLFASSETREGVTWYKHRGGYLEEGELSTAEITAVCPVFCSVKYSNIQNIIFSIVNGIRGESVHKRLTVLEMKYIFVNFKLKNNVSPVRN
jgi:hypothetical protein